MVTQTFAKTIFKAQVVRRKHASSFLKISETAASHFDKLTVSKHLHSIAIFQPAVYTEKR